MKEFNLVLMFCLYSVISLQGGNQANSDNSGTQIEQKAVNGGEGNFKQIKSLRDPK